jgi:hypothetical protein
MAQLSRVHSLKPLRAGTAKHESSEMILVDKSGSEINIVFVCCSSVRTTWFRQNHDTILCSSSSA